MTGYVTKIALLVLIMSSIVVGGWALFLPYEFYNAFPGFGHAWVSVDGPYNEHLLRDVGGLNLGIAGLSLLALIRPTLASPRAVGVASGLYNVPHFLYHVQHLGVLTPLDQIANVLALGGVLLASMWLLLSTAITTKT